MHDLLNRRVYQTASIAGESTGDKATWAPALPIQILRWGLINLDSETIDVGVGMVVSLEWRPTVSSDTNRAVIDTISTGTTDVPIGGGLYSDLVSGFDGESTASDGSIFNDAPSADAESAPDNFIVYPGEELVVEVTDAADTNADSFQVFIEYVERPFSEGRDADSPRLVKVNS